MTPTPAQLSVLRALSESVPAPARAITVAVHGVAKGTHRSGTYQILAQLLAGGWVSINDALSPATWSRTPLGSEMVGLADLAAETEPIAG